MAAISLSYLTSAVNARALLRFLLSSRATRIRYRLASTLTRCGVFSCRAVLVTFLGVLLVVCIFPELFIMEGAE